MAALPSYGAIQMFEKSKFYSVIAGIYDFYLLTFLLGAIFALSTYLRQTAINPLLALSMIPIGIIVTALYYLLISARIRWCSPGELLVGRRVGADRKEWGNPFGYNRWALFLITFVVLAFASNTWDSIGTGHIYTRDEVILRCIFLLLLSCGVTGVGRGQIVYVWFVVIYYAFYAWQIAHAPLGPIPQEALQMLALSFLSIGGLYLIVILTYAFLRIRNAP